MLNGNWWGFKDRALTMQQINFYQSTFNNQNKVPLDALQIAMVTISFIIVMSCYILFKNFSIAHQKESLVVEQQLLEEKENSLKKIRQDTKTYLHPEEWHSHIMELEQKENQQKAILAYLSDFYTTSQRGFSNALAELSRYHVDGIWLKQFSLKNGGSSIIINGRSENSELIPTYIERLARANSFDKQQFSLFQMKQVKNESYYEFDLHTLDEKIQ
ncbi:MAG TPA: hypothetical protein DCR13_03325 [Gammaproteobacteria bacterium]|nr:hypothetical protein [Gammaproteobacteria bacterium]